MGEEQIAEAQETLDLLTSSADMIWSVDTETAKEMYWTGASYYYIRDFANPTFEEAVADVDVPILVMQGGRDFQVLAEVDFAMMKELLGNRNNVDFKLYDNIHGNYGNKFYRARNRKHSKSGARRRPGYARYCSLDF